MILILYEKNKKELQNRNKMEAGTDCKMWLYNHHKIDKNASLFYNSP